MRIGIQTWGSEGDIRPFLALSAGLAQAGHRVTLVVTAVEEYNYSPVAERLGFDLKAIATPIVDDIEKFEDIGRLIVYETNPLKQASELFESLFEPYVAQMYQASLTLCETNDLVIGHYFCYPLAIAAEEKGVRCINVLLVYNILETQYAPPLGFPNLGVLSNKLCWKLVSKIISKTLLTYPNRLRTLRGLSPVKDMIRDVWLSKTMNLVAVSPSLCERREDWPDSHKICGFFNLPEDAQHWEMPASLVDFLQSGEAPVYMTFGSLMPQRKSERKAAVELFTRAANLAQCRAIIQVNESEQAVLSAAHNIYYLGRAPHHKIFPQCAAVVHHGGAGTTQSACTAGLPSIVVAHIAEQVFWGKELQKLGLAPSPLHRRTLTAERLAKKIRLVLRSPHMRQSAVQLRRKMAGEDGVKRALAFIGEFLRAEFGK